MKAIYMIGNNLKNNQRGFSLAEMLVTVGVFTIALVIISAVFVNINKLQQNTANLEQLQNEGRYVMEKISKEIRGRELDYSALSINDGVSQSLVFKEDEYGEVLSIEFDNSNKSIKIASAKDEQSIVNDLSSDSVIVEDAKFFLSPASDPYSVLATSTLQIHPRVTIFLKLKNKEKNPEYQKQLNLQTTISSKVYR